MTQEPTVRDNYRVVYCVFYFIGIITLLPWNFFLVVNAYWMYKLRDIGQDVVVPANVTLMNDAGEISISTGKMSDLQISWGPYLSMSAMIPNVICLLLNVLFGSRTRAEPRIYCAMIVIIVVFIYSTIMTSVNTDSWQFGFMIVTLFTVVIINIMTAVFQGGFVMIAGRFPPSYMGAMVQGQALGGIIASAVNVIMLVTGLDNVKAALYDFVIAIIFMTVGLIAYIYSTRLDFYKHYTSEDTIAPPAVKETEKAQPDEAVESERLLEKPTTPEAMGATSGESETNVVQNSFIRNIFFIAKTIWPWIVSTFLCFLVTLAVFPSITQLAQSIYPENAWGQIYFIPVGCFLLFNVCDFLGRMMASFIQWPNNKTRGGGFWALLMSILRVAFIPLFLYCNVSPANRKVTQVSFASDAVYLILMALFSLSNGYIGGVTMLFAPKMFTASKDQGVAASMMIFFLVFGLAIGSALSGLIVLLL